jgi:general stress protein 26
MAKGKGGGKAAGDGDAKKLRKLVKGARVAMLTTVAPDGALRSRPMAALKAPLGEELFFFTRASAPKADEIRDNDHVNVTFADTESDRYLSISGRASVVKDPGRIADLWSGRLKAWFPEGRKDPDLALLQVRVERAEYWDSKKAGMVQLVAGGERPEAAPEARNPAHNRGPVDTRGQGDNRKGDPGAAPTGSGAQG